jgi:hypothetical protein
MWRP